MEQQTGAGELDPDKPARAARGTKGIIKKLSLKAGTEYEDAEGAEGLQEAVHVCPLCVSQLDEEIDEESLLEHLNVVVGLVDRLSQLQEGDEDIETVIDETIQELLFPASEEE